MRNRILMAAAIVASLAFLAGAAFASTYFGPVLLAAPVTISSTSWVKLVEELGTVSESNYVCQSMGPGFPDFCYYDNMATVHATVRDANAATGLKYRVLLDGSAASGCTVAVRDNGDGSASLSCASSSVKNGPRRFTLQAAKKLSTSPTTVIDPAAGDAVAFGVGMAKP